MKLTVTHTLTLPLASPPRLVAHLLLTPLGTPQQKVERWSIEVAGTDHATPFRDGYGNKAHLVSRTRPGDSLVVTVTGVIETSDKAGVVGRLDFDPPPAMFLRRTESTRPDPDLATDLPRDDGRLAALHALLSRVHERSSSVQSQAAGTQEQALGTSAPAGLAHTFIGAARALDIPARFVTGYRVDGNSAAMHAWAEAWDEGLGWVGFDPSLNLCPADTHIRLASGLDAATATPIRTVPAATEAPAITLEVVAG